MYTVRKELFRMLRVWRLHVRARHVQLLAVKRCENEIRLQREAFVREIVQVLFTLYVLLYVNMYVYFFNTSMYTT